jgi:hypothetical protein
MPQNEGRSLFNLFASELITVLITHFAHFHKFNRFSRTNTKKYIMYATKIKLLPLIQSK